MAESTHGSAGDYNPETPPPRDPDAMDTGEHFHVGETTPHPPAPPGFPPAAPQRTFVTCPNCGYNLTGTPIGGNCPECNLVIGRGTVHNPQLPTSGYAIASLVLGICAIVLGCGSYGLFGLICGPLAIFFAGSASRQIRAQECSPGSAGLATAGRVMGWIGLSLALLVIVVVVLVFALPLLLSIASA